MFCDFMSIIEDKKIMSEILGIGETDEEELLFQAFAKQYGELWLTTDKRQEELVTRLTERAMCVLEKYREREDKTCSGELVSEDSDS